jgi:hypothetical protein
LAERPCFQFGYETPERFVHQLVDFNTKFPDIGQSLFRETFSSLPTKKIITYLAPVDGVYQSYVGGDHFFGNDAMPRLSP